MSRFYAAYGSNLNIIQMRKRCPTATVVGSATLHGFRLVFRGQPGNSVATVEHDSAATVPVLIWDVNNHDERALDSYEGWPVLYSKMIVPIVVGSYSVKAFVYVMNPRYNYGTPSQSYYHTILEGYEEAGFDLSTLEIARDFSKALMPKEDDHHDQ